VVIRSLTLPLSGRGLNAEPRLTRVRFVPLAGEALSALCDQLHRGSVRCVMVRFVTGLYTAIIHCG